MPNTKNLWPDALLEENDIVLPITALNEQAKFLNNMTKNVVTANIDTVTISIAQKNSDDPKSGILYTMKIVAPAIGNYDFELLRIIQEDFLPYPVRVYAPLIDLKQKCRDFWELEKTLSQIFTNERTISTIQNLILQSKN